MLAEQYPCDRWSAFAAAGWATSFRVIVSESGETWVVEATKGGAAVEGRAASPEGAWRLAWQLAHRGGV